jgi:hypothetical protein
VDRLRSKLSSEQLEARIRKMSRANEGTTSDAINSRHARK